MSDLICLSVQQPWAWAIMAGHKGVENRSWLTHYRGLLGIHAGKSRESMDAGTIEFIESQGLSVPRDLPFGTLLGTVEIHGCLMVEHLKPNPWAFGPYCRLVRNPQLFRTPIPARGSLGLFRLPMPEGVKP